MSAPPRVVLDTNVVLSALLFSTGRLAGFRRAWQQGQILPLLSTTVVEELIAALAYPKFKLSPREREELLADYLPYGLGVPRSAKRPRLPDCRDPRDLPFLELAILGKARWLVSGDQDLLAVQHRFAFRIVTPRELLAQLEEGKD